MSFPKKIHVLGDKYKIKFVDDLHFEGEKSDASINDDNSTIEFDKELTEKEKWVALFHEVGHITCRRNGLHSNVLSEDCEEVICDTFAIAFYELMGQIFGDWHD